MEHREIDCGDVLIRGKANILINITMSWVIFDSRKSLLCNVMGDVMEIIFLSVIRFQNLQVYKMRPCYLFHSFLKKIFFQRLRDLKDCHILKLVGSTSNRGNSWFICEGEENKT